MEFLITTAIWDEMSNEYDQDAWRIDASDSYLTSGIKHIGNFLKMSLTLVVGLICAIVTPIFLFSDVIYQSGKAIYNLGTVSDQSDQTGSDGSVQKAINESNTLSHLMSKASKSPSTQNMNRLEEKRSSNSAIFCQFYKPSGLNPLKVSLNDTRKVSLNDIWNYPDERLERDHYYIQWLFIDSTISSVAPASPLITPEIQQAFLNDVELRTNLRISFDRMLKFYGLKRDTNTGVISKANNFDERSKIWINKENHNLLRITRILSSMAKLGCKEEAKALYTMLQELSLSKNSIQEIFKDPMTHWANIIHFGIEEDN